MSCSQLQQAKISNTKLYLLEKKLYIFNICIFIKIHNMHIVVSAPDGYQAGEKKCCG